MKLRGSMIEDQLEKELSRSLSNFRENRSDDFLTKSIRAHFPNAESAIVLEWVPDQAEDFYLVLIDDALVVGFDVPKGKIASARISEIDVNSYMQGLRKQKALKLAMALKIVRARPKII